jgi:NADH-quinone oxidoreductase subunit M
MDWPILSIATFEPLLGAFILILLPRNNVRLIKCAAAFFAGVGFLLSLVILLNYDTAAGGMQFVERLPWLPRLGIDYYLGVDGISVPMVLLTNIIGFAAVYASWHIDDRAKEFFILLLTLLTGLTGTFVTRDLIIFFIFFEVVVIPIYLMIIMWGSTKQFTKEYAGMKLTIYLLIGSAILLTGILALFVKAYALTGTPTMEIDRLAGLDYGSGFSLFVFCLMSFCFCTLISMFPFHAWSPDGHVAAPTAVSMLHAGVLKSIGGYGMIRIALYIFPATAKVVLPYICVLGLIGVIYAAYICINMKDMKYVVGFASVSHMGYVIVGITAFNAISLNAAVMMMFAHGLMAALFFSMVGTLYAKAHTRDIDDFTGLAHQVPRLATGFMIAGLASLGLPGMINFVGEFTTFMGVFQSFHFLGVIACSGIVFAAIYNLRSVTDVLFGEKMEKWDTLPDLNLPEMMPILVLGTAIFLGGIFPGPLMNMIDGAVSELLTLIGMI